MTRLLRSELLKIRTVNTWWIFALATVGTTGIALLLNCFQAHYYLMPFDEYMKARFGGATISGPELATVRADWLAKHPIDVQAAGILTSGQFLGVLFVSLLGILLITNEYYHQTATTTFLATPHRTSVVTAKLVTGIFAALVFWLLALIINLAVGWLFLASQGFGPHLGDKDVWQAILLNAMAYGIWAVFGVGLGALIRSQLGATITATVVYLAGTIAAQIVFQLIHAFLIKKDWVLTLQVIVPAVASTIMLSPAKTFAESPPQWVGAVVLIGYGILAGLIGTMILRKRDVS
jgi:ABC-2 type transport system permease protein